jgi:hypothetical protein
MPVLSFAAPAGVIYKAGDWIRYRYIVKTGGETCEWNIKVSIEEVGATQVKYSAGLEKLISGGGVCNSLTALLLLGLGLMSHTVDLSTATPESKDFLINPDYTGTYTYSNGKATYHKGVLIKLSENTTTPFVATTEISLIDTSIEELKGAPAGPNIAGLLVLLIIVVAAVVSISLVLIWVKHRHVAPPPPPPP